MKSNGNPKQERYTKLINEKAKNVHPGLLFEENQFHDPSYAGIRFLPR